MAGWLVSSQVVGLFSCQAISDRLGIFFKPFLFFFNCVVGFLEILLEIFLKREFGEMRCDVFFSLFFCSVFFFILKSHPLFVGVVWFACVFFCFQHGLLNDFRS